ncbi:MAG TPA: hypothetical protein VM012_06410 [Flavitalea sp.]|nr:hypothetical protein [Flavitalea sp.]
MKKLAAILLLSLLAFNWYGYRLVTAYLQQQASISIETQLDRNEYADADLIEFRVPMNLPYQSNWKEFERFDGEVEIDGVHYKYVKRKIENGALVVLCIPNKSKMKLQTSRDEFFKLVNDLKQSTSGKKSSEGHTAFKSFSTEYFQNISDWQITIPENSSASSLSDFFAGLKSGFVTLCEQPPDA